MGLQLIEAAVTKTLDYLRLNMPTKLNALDNEYDDFKLEDIAGWYAAEVVAVPAFPSIFILGDATDITSEGEGWLRSEHTITIVVLTTDQDAETLRRRLYRYVRAVVELLKAGRGDFGWTISFERADFSPLYAGEGLFVSDARLVVKLGKYES